MMYVLLFFDPFITFNNGNPMIIYLDPFNCNKHYTALLRRRITEMCTFIGS